MANQGLLAQLKPTSATDTVLYRAPIDASASTVLTVANDGTGSVYDVAVKDYDQKLTLDASTYLLHEGDIITSYRIALNTAVTSNSGFTAGGLITTTDAEKSFRFESFYIPPFTEIFVKEIGIREITIESISGTFVVGNTLTKGVSPDDTTSIIYGVGSGSLFIGPSTINGGGTEFAPGDTISVSGGASATISVGGVATEVDQFIFSQTTAGGTYNIAMGNIFPDRTYRFVVDDTSMTGRDFKLSSTVNGEWGPDGVFGTGDDGTEFTTEKTSSGTAGDGAGAYVQYAFGEVASPLPVYFYDGGTGTSTNSQYGGTTKVINESLSASEYDEIYVYDVNGTVANNVDTFTLSGVTYTITGQTSGAYGYVKDYTGTALKFIKGLNSADFAGTDTFRDVPKSNTADRSTATVSAVAVASDAVEASNYIVEGLANGNNEVDKITSLVVGPGEVVVVNSATANNTFSLIGFEDNSDSITTRVFGS